MKLPTAKQINQARDKVDKATVDQLRKILECWQGAGWHPEDIAWGILVGLLIAEKRATNS